MFNNRKDVEHFSSARLVTKRSKQGRILCPIGTHGVMKCMFSDSIDHNDTVSPNTPAILPAIKGDTTSTADSGVLRYLSSCLPPPSVTLVHFSSVSCCPIVLLLLRIAQPFSDLIRILYPQVCLPLFKRILPPPPAELLDMN